MTGERGKSMMKLIFITSAREKCVGVLARREIQQNRSIYDNEHRNDLYKKYSNSSILQATNY